MAKSKSNASTDAQNNAAMKAAQLREQEGKKALKGGDKTRAQENFCKAAANYLKTGDLEGNIRCLAECGELVSSIALLLKTFNPVKVVSTVRKYLKPGLDLGLCYLTATNVTGNVKRFSATKMLLECASNRSPEKAIHALKGAALAASWEEKPDITLSVTTILSSFLNKCLDDGCKTVDEKKLVLDSIIVLQAHAAMTDDLSLFQEIDRLQMRYVRLAGGQPEGDIFVRSFFPMFLARGQDLDELRDLANDSPTLRPYVDAYDIFAKKSKTDDFESLVRLFEEKIEALEDRPNQVHSLTTWSDVTERFYGAKYFMPELLSAKVVRHQYQEHTKRLEDLAKILSKAAHDFIKKKYKKSLTEFLNAIDSEAFLSLPTNSQRGVLENAAHAAFEIENWNTFDKLCSRLEDEYNLENVVQLIIEE